MFLLISLLLLATRVNSSIVRDTVDECDGMNCTLTLPICINSQCRGIDFINHDIFVDIATNTSYGWKLHLREMYKVDNCGRLENIPIITPFIIQYQNRFRGELLVLVTDTKVRFLLRFHGAPVSEQEKATTTRSLPPDPTPYPSKIVAVNYYAYLTWLFGGIIFIYLIYRIISRYTPVRRDGQEIALHEMDTVRETLL